MDTINGWLVLGQGITLVSLGIWIGLIGAWGQFWRADQRLPNSAELLEQEHHAIHPEEELYPAVSVVIPARNEADLLPVTLQSLLIQSYPGELSIILVDDHSTDGTATVAQETAQQVNQGAPQPRSLHVLAADPLPSGWVGKLWALEQGIRYAQQQPTPPKYVLLTDADIAHDPMNLRQLVTKAEQEKLALASLMVKLRCQSLWEFLLIPAFVFFFQKLYPFRWVNNPHRATAAAAGGCILIRSETLDRIGGLTAIRHTLIDDCALAHAVKLSPPPHTPHPIPYTLSPTPHTPIWLGLTDSTHSLRPYPSLQSIWDMVARTAYTQLHYSPLLLIGTLIGMTLIYLVPPLATLGGIPSGHSEIALGGLLAWALITIAYLPTVRLYNGSPFLALGLPMIAGLYTLMTLDSACRHWQGRGGNWKGRVYSS